MKKILFLHGLESEGVKKTRHLATKGLVYAPHIDYEENPGNIFNETLELVKELKPDLIVGRSLGGYFAEKLATHVKTEVLLFNPATINEWTYYDNMDIETTTGNEVVNGTVVIGTEDDIINPVASGEYYIKNPNTKIHLVDMGHRTTTDVFRKYVAVALRSFVTNQEK